MSSTSRALGAALTVGIALTATACGGGATPATGSAEQPAAATSSAAPTPAAPITPEVAEAAVAPTPTEESAVRLFGQDGVESGYRELVDLATNLAFDPDTFLHEESTQPTDLDPVLAGRLHQNQADFVRSQAEVCDGDHPEACGDVMGIAYFDLALSADSDTTLAYRPDGQFVTEQSITNPTVTTSVVQGQDSLHVQFDHTAQVRLLAAGTPVTVTMSRHVSYDLWEAPVGNATRWWIVDWGLHYQGDVRDEATGLPFEG